MSRNDNSAAPGLTPTPAAGGAGAPPDPGPAEGPSRRRLLASAGAALGPAPWRAVWPRTSPTAAGSRRRRAESGATIPFYGAHQAGHRHPGAGPAGLRLAERGHVTLAGPTSATCCAAWTGAAARMTRGQLVGEDTELNAPPVDTGEAVGSPVSRLTITIGYGPSLFDHRFGLAGKRPAALAPLPPLPNENLDPNYSGGDLCVQACSDDPLVAFHAVRNLARLGMGVVAHNWMELGFGRTSTTTTAQATPRNLLGFKDGTRNIKAEETRLMDEQVWVGRETDQPWLRGGSYLVTRKIRMFVENWDRDYLQRPGERHRPGQGLRAPRSAAARSSPPRTSRPGSPASTRSRPTRTSGWPATSTTAGPGSCAAATPSPTASTRRPARCSAACSSSRS